jgi:hypothetical protein
VPLDPRRLSPAPLGDAAMRDQAPVNYEHRSQ